MIVTGFYNKQMVLLVDDAVAMLSLYVTILNYLSAPLVPLSPSSVPRLVRSLTSSSLNLSSPLNSALVSLLLPSLPCCSLGGLVLGIRVPSRRSRSSRSSSRLRLRLRPGRRRGVKFYLSFDVDPTAHKSRQPATPLASRRHLPLHPRRSMQLTRKSPAAGSSSSRTPSAA